MGRREWVTKWRRNAQRQIFILSLRRRSKESCYVDAAKVLFLCCCWAFESFPHSLRPPRYRGKVLPRSWEKSIKEVLAIAIGSWLSFRVVLDSDCGVYTSFQILFGERLKSISAEKRVASVNESHHCCQPSVPLAGRWLALQEAESSNQIIAGTSDSRDRRELVHFGKSDECGNSSTFLWFRARDHGALSEKGGQSLKEVPRTSEFFFFSCRAKSGQFREEERPGATRATYDSMWFTS